MKLLDIEKDFITSLQKWDLQTGAHKWRIAIPSEGEAREFYHGFLPLLVEIRERWRLEEIQVVYEGCLKPYRVVDQMNGEISMQAVQEQFSDLIWVSDEIAITIPILVEMERMINSPGLAGICRMRDHRQMILNAKMADALPCTPQEAVKRDIRNFTLHEDLREMERRARQESAFVFSYRTALDDKKLIWRRITNSYHIVEDRFGDVFRVGEIQDIEEIANPSRR